MNDKEKNLLEWSLAWITAVIIAYILWQLLLKFLSNLN
jgi:hypothetical protein